MRNTFNLFVVFSLIDIFFMNIMLGEVIDSFINNNYLFLLVWLVVLSSSLNLIMKKHKNFNQYYPHFEDKWLFSIETFR